MHHIVENFLSAKKIDQIGIILYHYDYIIIKIHMFLKSEKLNLQGA